MADHDKLVIASMALRGAAPNEWSSFAAAVREFAALQVADMLRAPPDMLLKAQGMALGMAEISKIINEAPALFDQIGVRRTSNGRPASKPPTAFSV